MVSTWDENLFYWINSGWSNVFFDFLMPVLRNKYTWIPLYTFLMAFFLFNFGKKGYYYILLTILTVACSDMVSNHGFKKNFKRLRPCNTELSVPIVERIPCGSGYSFTSNHAANHFALATFFSMVFGWKNRKIRYAFMAWATMIALAQVYVGLHYPFDVIGGALLGSFIGFIIAKTGERWIGYDTEPPDTV
ncbi:MAG: phosphatase PAP2 family protein [Saprospiraceae bacterium]|nr:phosphatase PAP2 family protein [Saprospiraceae bacterium]MBK7525533.1 phosphatase PAP2 family protein [Saprospiraceae bacterium]MBK8855669.1 phosphatase PAP2 family protein [Saprospiraceae bacterium]MBK9043484.1 phosphatase PAP2 family protein [Saprospiraceae bacterium]